MRAITTVRFDIARLLDTAINLPKELPYDYRTRLPMITTKPDRYGGERRCAPHRIAHRAGAILFNSDGTLDDEVVRRRAGGHLGGNTDLHQIEAVLVSTAAVRGPCA
jgi:hypothetical protein